MNRDRREHQARSGRARFLTVLALAALATPVPAQQWERYLKDSRSIRQTFRAVTERNRGSVVVLLRDGSPCAQGCIVHPDGWVLTKASELHGSLSARLADGSAASLSTQVVEDTCDLALVKLDVPGPLPPIAFEQDQSPRVGQLAVALSADEVPLAIGVVSTPARAIERDRGLLGVEMGDSRQGPEVTRVLPRTSAALLGLQRGDVILRVDQRAFDSRESLIRSLSRKRVLDEVVLEVLRGEETLRFVVQLGSFDQDSESMNGPLSRVRSGFASAFQHDCIVHPDDCGGPIVDLEGDVIGINIARCGRTGCYAVPAEKVLELLPNLLAEARAKRASEVSH